jgi:hypothetical protein
MLGLVFRTAGVAGPRAQRPGSVRTEPLSAPPAFSVSKFDASCAMLREAGCLRGVTEQILFNDCPFANGKIRAELGRGWHPARWSILACRGAQLYRRSPGPCGSYNSQRRGGTDWSVSGGGVDVIHHQLCVPSGTPCIARRQAAGRRCSGGQERILCCCLSSQALPWLLIGSQDDILRAGTAPACGTTLPFRGPHGTAPLVLAPLRLHGLYGAAGIARRPVRVSGPVFSSRACRLGPSILLGV